jgi:hypothetical protein
MEIKTAFATIVGILMMVTVTVATVVIMGGLTQVCVEECNPAEYTADRNYGGVFCGYVYTGTNRYEVFCGHDDACFDQNKNLCCLTSASGTEWGVKVANGRCCNVTKLSTGCKSDIGPSKSCLTSQKCEVCERWDWSLCSCVPTSCCLEQGSLILTPEGFKSIEDLKEGDYVIGYEDDKKIPTKVTEKSIHEGEFTLYLYKGYWFTGNHLVYLDDHKDFKPVTELSKVTKQYNGKVYNIQTETHNYFGENDILIHNK